ncbi:MAG TPA: GTP-binding protein [Polyangiaceae bacterium]|nr:GTP-binding protein [Polyangiaceae bacterium]
MFESPIAVTIVTGFLGAGKSTLLQKWLEELPRHQTAVIVNERGEVGIDGELLAARVAQLREITGGCVCCQTQAELTSALDELSSGSPRPTRIVIETSGAASPSGVIRAVGAPWARDRLVLDGVITVVDVVRATRALGFDVAVEQLGFADVVVLSHVDEAGGASGVDVDAVEQTLSRHAPAAVMVRAERGAIETSFLELLAQRAEALHVVPEGTGHASIEAVSLMLDGELDEEQFGDWVESALADVEARILRVKGILAMRGVEARVIVQGISEAVDVVLGAPWGDAQRTSRLVVLGLGLDAAALEAGFMRCAAKAAADDDDSDHDDWV